MDLFEAIYSQRAMRRLKTDPVPDELIWKVLDAAIRAPSGGNRQPWNFIVIKDEATKKQIAEWYLESWNQAYGPMRQAAMSVPAMSKTFASADYLANHLAEVPVFIIATVNHAGVAPSLARSVVSPPSRT
jgi:nitroreductase